MGAQAWSRGAVHLWYGFPGTYTYSGSSGAIPTVTAAYLGTGERAPRVNRRRRFRDLPNDLGGDVPFDVAYMGSEAFVTVKLTRWDDEVLRAIENVPGPTAGQDLAGFDIAGDIGALMLTEGLAGQLWVMYSYAAGGVAPQPAFAKMRSGWHFLAAWPHEDDTHEGGTDPASTTLTFRCLRLYDPPTGTFKLYDRNMANLTPPT